MSSTDRRVAPRVNTTFFATVIGLFWVAFIAFACSGANNSTTVAPTVLKPTESVARLAFYEWAKCTNQHTKMKRSRSLQMMGHTQLFV